MPGRGRDQIGGEPLGADIIYGPDDPERIRRFDPSFQVGTQCGRHRLLSGERTADIRERRRKRFLRDRRPGENELKKEKNESHRCNRALKMQGKPGFCNDDASPAEQNHQRWSVSTIAMIVPKMATTCDRIFSAAPKR